jgi:hypothetical protein
VENKCFKSCRGLLSSILIYLIACQKGQFIGASDQLFDLYYSTENIRNLVYLHIHKKHIKEEILYLIEQINEKAKINAK